MLRRTHGTKKNFAHGGDANLAHMINGDQSTGRSYSDTTVITPATGAGKPDFPYYDEHRTDYFVPLGGMIAPGCSHGSVPLHV